MINDEEGPLSFSEAMYVARCMSEGMSCPPSMISRFYNPPAPKLIKFEIPEVKPMKLEPMLQSKPMKMDTYEPIDIFKPAKSKKYNPLGLNNF